ncbi:MULTISPECIES: flagellar hook-basal body complex protein FliE [Aneurinibacillus]|jgi:flagellar hook-basal body complex protein FliE|uniref:Flagellar hook-basal body complex protein FliE n=1 Tax=Aneurinibacillus thermoaerophilus TaxID=143495 RepID=A0A1G7WE91_ANETH|nr:MULTISPECIES: flagellar hook-basal body complex protein FliE [Aneurinibacillus]AMA72665.1 hypothetical protein ACH33_07240 [Aneurinibacillus sp. XH2]MED0674618.1 flagellar hook-basal body complex protein FliE [Aneurinibacillus thermoaerophilus]MED0677987.1 flagellar hook-basal body complex protein FliE [Aneurinibacillus thermoaerophilus]MED0736950.1 flagellar hook-basal body complex protein FliE [Aneurinibacillus thermoaerophilus]MED0756791.1 flagellar hook-basal body complex protein FliE [
MVERIGAELPSISVQDKVPTGAPTPYEVTTSFASYLKNALHEVNALQKASEKMNQGLAAGQIQDLHQVMIASQKSGIALELTMQLRNKVVEAYQEIMRMQI